MIHRQAVQLAFGLLNEAAQIGHMHLPIRIQLANGEKISGTFNGYWDLRAYGGTLQPAISYPVPGSDKLTTGILPQGATILTPYPSFEQWTAQQQAQQQQQQPINAA